MPAYIKGYLQIKMRNACSLQVADYLDNLNNVVLVDTFNALYLNGGFSNCIQKTMKIASSAPLSQHVQLPFTFSCAHTLI